MGAAVLAPAVGKAAPATPASDAELAHMIRFRVERQRAATGILVGVLRPAGPSILAFGSARDAAGPPVGADTIFEVASLTKVFTALLLADAVVRGEARLDDPLQAYAPPGVKVPAFQGREITLTDLATHTAGLPLRPDNLKAAPDAFNKYAAYTVDQLWAGLPGYRLTRAPGSAFEYSNVGVSLLGHALARRLEVPYPELLRRRVIEPLGLADTRFGDDPAKADRRAQNHDIDLKPIGPTDFGALSPGGGLRSTGRDVMRFVALFLDGKGPEQLVQASRLMLTVDRPGDNPGTRMVLGWRRVSEKGETFYWSDGTGDGSRTFMGFNPGRRLGVAAMANAATGLGMEDIGTAAIAPGQTVDLTIPKRHTQIDLPREALQRFVGLYRYAPGDEFAVSLGDHGLLVGAGPGQFPIYPQTPTRFFAKVADVQLQFRADGVVLRQEGKTFLYRRVP